MKKSIICTLLIFSIFLVFSNNTKKDNWSTLKGPYLGQKPPGLMPEIFAQEVISTDISEGCSGWGNHMEYFVFQRWIKRKPKLYILNQVDGVWSKPVDMGKEINSKKSENRPYVSPDGKYLFYASTKSGNRDIYWVDAKIIENLKPKNLK